MEIPHLAGSGLFSRADQPPPVEDLAGETRGEKLKALSDWLGDCTRCPLHAGRNMVVFGETNPDASLVFVGEGPGADEDASGRPFVGRAGQLLTKMIEAMSLRREDVYICNVVKCRPPGNRAPNADEEAICGPVMYRQLEIIRPELIIALGAPAMHALLERKDGITKMRGRLFRYGDSLVLPTFHPAYLLRSPSQKKLVWEDLKLACAVLGLKPRPKQG
ncbi:MAG: uracil-DNA glycosylase [Planctomycetes bacterium]|nr:uracil-DNA glycosylase [Planctomycetota bacterium]